MVNGKINTLNAPDEFQQNIEYLRKKLFKDVKPYGLSSQEAIQKSQELDDYIYLYLRDFSPTPTNS